MGKNGRSNTLIATVAGLVIVLGVFILIATLFTGTRRESEVAVVGDRVEIKGQYGTTVDIEDITDVRLVDVIPAIGAKVNGAGLGEIKKGDFRVEDLGICRLIIHSKAGPYIIIEARDKPIIMNFYEAARTAAVFAELKKAWAERGA